MLRGLADNLCGCGIEVHSLSLERRAVILPRLYKALATCGCWTLRYKRCGAHAVEYSFEVELAAMLDLYCGLAQAGLEMTDLSHRALTELCMLRSHAKTLQGSRCLTPRMVNVRLRMGFVDPEERMALSGVAAASA